MYIQTERTPNPASLKFLPGQVVMAEGTAYFADAAAGARSPLASALFAIEGVSNVFLGADFITVVKDDDAPEWQELKVPVLAAIMHHFSSGAQLFEGEAVLAASDSADDSEDEDIIIQIKELIDSKVRPAVARDGGDIVYHGFRDGIVYLHMQGSCAGCPSSTATLKGGIESLLRHYVPEVNEVRAI